MIIWVLIMVSSMVHQLGKWCKITPPLILVPERVFCSTLLLHLHHLHHLHDHLQHHFHHLHLPHPSPSAWWVLMRTSWWFQWWDLFLQWKHGLTGKPLQQRRRRQSTVTESQIGLGVL